MQELATILADLQKTLVFLQLNGKLLLDANDMERAGIPRKDLPDYASARVMVGKRNTTPKYNREKVQEL
jgi:hypothetical protein